MDIEKINDIVKDVENKPNKDLFLAVAELGDEFEKTKTLIIDLTNHLENVENMYNNVNREIEKRIKK
jgi:hypothetical protein